MSTNGDKKMKEYKIKCPYCSSKVLEETEIGGNLRSEFSWEHEASYCKNCGTTFTIWDEPRKTASKQ